MRAGGKYIPACIFIVFHFNLKNMKLLSAPLILLTFLLNGFTSSAQCNWTQVYYESYEYTTVIPYLLPGTTYQNTPQTYAGCIRTGSYGMYMNIVDGYSGLLYSQPFTDMCIGQQYRFSFSTRDAWTSTNNLTIQVKDNNGTILVSQNVINGSTWNDITMASFTTTTSSVVFEIITNAAGTGGNDVGFDDLRLFQCQPTPLNFQVTECAASTNSLNLFSEITPNALSQNGVWTGPSTLTNGYLGTFTAGTNANGTYHYTIDGAPGCADSIANIQVALIQTPDLDPVQNVTACTYYVLPAISGTNLSGNQRYYTGPNGTGNAYLPGAAITTAQTLYIYDGAAGCSDQVSFTITFIPPPVITVSGNDTICAGGTAVFTASSTSPNMTYVWTPGNATGATLSVNPTATTVYSVVGTNAFGCTSNTVSTTAVVRPAPVLTLQVSEDTICTGEQVQLMVTSSINGTTYVWNDGTTQPVRIVSPASNSVYSVVGTSPNGCTDSKTASVLVIPQLEATISGATSFCEGSSTTLSVTGNVPGMVFTWTPAETTGQTLVVNQSGVGWVYVEGAYHGCPVGTDSIFMTVSPNPVVAVPDDFQVCPGEPVTATVSSNVPNSSFVWTPGNLSGATNTLHATTSTMYYVYAQNGSCVSEVDSFYIDISQACFLEVPNIFTPNGDQVNDYFSLVSYSGIASLQIDIVNRWGNPVRSFSKPDFQWDGKDETGKEMAEGVYFYRLTAVLGSGQELVKQGFIEVLR